MEMMNTRKIAPVAAALAALSLIPAPKTAAADPEGTVSYALPKTTLTFEVEAVQEKFHAGPYAKYARKYLGVDAKEQDETTFQIASVKVTSRIEADQSARYATTLSEAQMRSFMQLSSQGLIATGDGLAAADESVWRFPVKTGVEFNGEGTLSNYISESATLYRSSKEESRFGKTEVHQSMVVEKSPDKKAQEAAEMIFKLRRTRVQIVTGDTDASYSGEAMAAALSELGRLENEYMTLFTGYSEYQTQTKRFDLTPSSDASLKAQVVFRLSDEQGLLGADNMSGKPWFVTIKAEQISPSLTDERGSKPARVIMYRIPAICAVKLSDGTEPLIECRLPVYQLGQDKKYPLNK